MGKTTVATETKAEKAVKRWTSTHKNSGVAVLNRNGHHSVACVSWKVKASIDIRTNDTSDAIDYTNNSIYASLTLSDCNKAVHLDFDCYKNSDVNNSIYKIDTLIRELENFRKSLIKGAKIFRKGIKYKKYKEKSDLEGLVGIVTDVDEHFMKNLIKK